jgi:phenylacetate-CoA ligase
MSKLPRRPIIQMYQLATGRRLLDRLDELNKNQWLKREDLLSLRRQKLYSLLTYACEYVPYYRSLFDREGFRPASVLSDLSSFHRLPVLTKDLIRENFEALQTTEDRTRKHLSEKTTSGSTGHPLVFMQDGNFRDYVTADIHRHLGWSGWNLGDDHCYLWASHLELAESQALRTKFMNWTLNRFVTNAFVLSEENMNDFASRIRRRRPEIIFGYPSSLSRFAQFVKDRHFDDIKFRAVFSSAEMIFPEQRVLIEETFNGKVFNRYGTLELGGIGCECQAHTGLHVSMDNNYVEIVKDGRQAQPGEDGDIIVTNLNNFGMPFIRYAIEDVGSWNQLTSCPCGRQLPLMDISQGRRVDLFRSKDGRTVRAGYVGYLFGLDGVKQFQLVQKSLDLIVARIVKDGELSESVLKNVETKLKESLGDDVTVQFEFTDKIPVLESGKYCYAISEVQTRDN